MNCDENIYVNFYSGLNFLSLGDNIIISWR